MTKSKRFIIFSQYFPPEIGASQTRLAALARELMASGHSVEVITALPHHLKGKIFSGYGGKFYVRETWEGVTVHRTWVYASPSGSVGRRLLNYGSFAATSLIGLFAAQRADYVFVESPPLFLALPAAILSAFKNVPLILNVADLWPESVKMLGVVRNGVLLGLAERLERWAYRRSRYVNAVTEGIYEGLRTRRAISASSILFLPNGVDTADFSPRAPDVELVRKHGLEGKKVFLYAGTHGLAYRLDLVLDIAQRLEKSNIVFIMVGDGYTKEALVRRATEQSLHNVIFIDSQPESEMPRYFSIAYASVIPLAKNKLFEGTRPAKLFPSLASGVPVIYSGAGEGSRLLLDAGAGLVVPAESPEDLAQAVLLLSADSSLHDRMARSGRQYAVTNFSWQKIVAEWLSQLQDREAKRGASW